MGVIVSVRAKNEQKECRSSAAGRSSTTKCTANELGPFVSVRPDVPGAMGLFRSRGSSAYNTGTLALKAQPSSGPGNTRRLQDGMRLRCSVVSLATFTETGSVVRVGTFTDCVVHVGTFTARVSAHIAMMNNAGVCSCVACCCLLVACCRPA